MACIVGILLASPAAADEAVSYGPRADALTLLMLDQRTTYATTLANRMLALPLAGRFDVRGAAPVESVATDLHAFEQMAVAPHVAVPLTKNDGTISIVVFADAPWWSGVHFDSGPVRPSRYSAHQAVLDLIAQTKPPQRPPVLLDGRLVLRIDGDEETPTLSVGGGLPAALWSVMPRE